MFAIFHTNTYSRNRGYALRKFKNRYTFEVGGGGGGGEETHLGEKIMERWALGEVISLRLLMCSACNIPKS